MRASAFLVIAFCVCVSHATTYYFSSSTGDDSRSAAQAQNPATPWATIAQANTLTLAPGDSVLFKAGDTFRGALQVRGSGNAAGPIVYGMYGTGQRPVISGTEPIPANWTPLGDGVYRAQTTTPVRQFFFYGESMTSARHPNAGYFTVDSALSARTSFRDSEAGSSVNWTGASLHIRTEPWSLDARVVSAFSAGTFTLNAGTNYDINSGESYFINNHIGALDNAGEWYWDSLAGTVTFATPDGATPRLGINEGTVYDIGILLDQRSNVVVENFVVFGHHSYGVRVSGNSSSCTIRNCDVIYAYGTGISAGGGNGIRVENCIVDGSNFYGIESRGANAVLTGNTVRRIGLVNRLGARGLGGGCCQARGIDFGGRNSVVSYNRLDSIGYNAIGFGGQNQLIERNEITYYCLTTYDGSAIYTWSAQYTDSGAAGSIIRENLITGGAGPGRAIVAPGWWSNGIYLDDRTHDIAVEHNTIVNTYHGIYFHNTKRHTARGNTVFDCTDYSLLFTEDQNGAPGEMSDNIVTGNEIFALDNNHACVRIGSQYNSWHFFARLDSNRYWNPYTPISVYRNWRPGYPSDNAWENNLFSLAQWRTVSGHDINSKANVTPWTPYAITDTLGPAMIVNGTFDAATTGWSCWSERSLCSITWNSSAGRPAGCLQAALTRHDSVSYAIVISPAFRLEQGATYALRLSARAARTAVFQAYARMNHTPWSGLGLSAPFSVDSSWRDFEFVFKATASDSSSRIDLQYQRGDSLWWLDNVSLLKVDTQSVDNRARTFLAVNRSTATAAIPLPSGTWQDLDGSSYQSSISLAPYRSRILITDTPLAFGGRRISAGATTARPQLLCRTLGDSRVAVTVRLTREDNARIEITDLSGRRVALLYNGRLSEGSHRFVWTRGSGNSRQTGRGTYLVTLRAGGNTITSRAMVL